MVTDEKGYNLIELLQGRFAGQFRVVPNVPYTRARAKLPLRLTRARYRLCNVTYDAAYWFGRGLAAARIEMGIDHEPVDREPMGTDEGWC